MQSYAQYREASTYATEAERFALHRAHFAQAVTPALIRDVVAYFGEDRISATTSPHLSEIPCTLFHGRCWDDFADRDERRLTELYARATGEKGTSLSDRVCIIKEAARQYRDANPRTCDNCAQSQSKDPKCGLCCGPTSTRTLWQKIIVSA